MPDPMTLDEARKILAYVWDNGCYEDEADAILALLEAQAARIAELEKGDFEGWAVLYPDDMENCGGELSAMRRDVGLPLLTKAEEEIGYTARRFVARFVEEGESP